MAQPHKKINHLEIEHTSEPARPVSPKEDFTGRFLARVARAFVTGLISPAISNQVNWWIVALAFGVSRGARAFVTGLISPAISNQVNWWIVALAFGVSRGALRTYQKFA